MRTRCPSLLSRPLQPAPPIEDLQFEIEIGSRRPFACASGV